VFILVRVWRTTAAPRRTLGARAVAARSSSRRLHGARETLGLAHICLQPLVLLRARGAGAHARRSAALAARARRRATVDFLLGIALHFGVQSRALDRCWPPAAPSRRVLGYSQFAV